MHGTRRSELPYYVQLSPDALEAEVVVADEAVEAVGASVVNGADLGAATALAIELHEMVKHYGISTSVCYFVTSSCNRYN